MKKLNLFMLFADIFLIILVVQLNTYKMEGQDLSPMVNCSGGETFYAQNYSLDFVIGEPLSESYEMQQTMLTQGFLQDIVGPTAISEIQAQLPDITLYPNPVLNSLSIDFGNYEAINWYEIISIHGISIEKSYCERNLGNIDISHIKPGIYLLIVGVENHDPITKRFIKK